MLRLSFFTFLGLSLLSGGDCHADWQLGAQKAQNRSDAMEPVDEVYVWLATAVSAVSVGLSGILPLAIVPLVTGSSLQSEAFKSWLNVFLSFAVGSLLADVFLHLLPEAWASLQTTEGALQEDCELMGAWVIAGIMTFLVLEKLFPDDSEEDDHSHKKENGKENPAAISANGKVGNGSGELRRRGKAEKPSANPTSQSEPDVQAPTIKVTGYLNLLANFIDNFTHGIAVAGSYLVSLKVGMCTTIAILLHEIPHEIGDFAILLDAGFDIKRAAKGQIITACGGLLGALCVLLVGSAEKAGSGTWWILPFTSGTFLYISLAKVIPELLESKSKWESLTQVLGIACGIAMVHSVSKLL